jgi:hypothetical protein
MVVAMFISWYNNRKIVIPDQVGDDRIDQVGDDRTDQVGDEKEGRA